MNLDRRDVLTGFGAIAAAAVMPALPALAAQTRDLLVMVGGTLDAEQERAILAMLGERGLGSFRADTPELEEAVPRELEPEFIISRRRDGWELEWGLWWFDGGPVYSSSLSVPDSLGLPRLARLLDMAVKHTRET